MSSNPLYPLAVNRIPDPVVSGGSYIGGSPRGVWHETITAPVEFYRKAIYYHIQFREWPLGSTPQIEQHIPFDRASRGLRNLTSTQRIAADLSPLDVQTNRMGSVNINAALVGYQTYQFRTPPAVSYPSLYPLSEAMVDTLATFMLWCQAEWGIPADVSALLGEAGQQEYGYLSPFRFTNAEWTTFTGWCGHERVTENTHHDPYWQFPKTRLMIAMATMGSGKGEDMWSKKLNEDGWRAVWRGGIAEAGSEANIVDYWWTNRASRTDAEHREASENMAAALAVKIGRQALSRKGVEPQFQMAWDWAVANGYVAAASDPDDLVTKEELMVFLHKATTTTPATDFGVLAAEIGRRIANG